MLLLFKLLSLHNKKIIKRSSHAASIKKRRYATLIINF